MNKNKNLASGRTRGALAADAESALREARAPDSR